MKYRYAYYNEGPRYWSVWLLKPYTGDKWHWICDCTSASAAQAAINRLHSTKLVRPFVV